MKKVMVYAYTTFNLGDDLFIKVLCERYPKTSFILYAPRKYKILFRDLKNLTIFPSDSIFVRLVNSAFNTFKVNNFIRKFISKRSDIGVYIGGSLFIQSENWRESVENVKEMRIKDRPFFLLGANFGPFKEKEYYLEYKEVFKKYTDICFREKISYDLFNDLSNVRLADDIVFQLKWSKVNKQDNYIVISVIKPSVRKQLDKYDDIYYKKIRDITTHFIDKGFKVTLMSFCENEGDDEAISKVMELIPRDYSQSVFTYLYKLDLNEALSIIANSNFVVATRFHSMILGWIFNKPVFPIVYSSKMTNVMGDVGFKGLFIDLSSIESLLPEKVFDSMAINPLDISKQVNNSERHFDKLDEILLMNRNDDSLEVN